MGWSISKPGMTFDLQVRHVDGNAAYIVWLAKTEDNVYEFATDTFFIEDDKIVVQSFAAKVVPQ